MKGPAITRGKRYRKKVNKKEKAEIVALNSLGHSNYAIEKRTGINHETIKKYLQEQEAYCDPNIKALAEKIAENEIFDLTVLTVKARKRLHELSEKMNPIEALALMDRTFQQRRLLEGKSTQNISTLTKIIREANKDLED